MEGYFGKKIQKRGRTHRCAPTHIRRSRQIEGAVSHLGQKALDGTEPLVPMPLALPKMPFGKHDAGLHAGRPELKVALDVVSLSHAGHPRGVYAPLFAVIHHTGGEVDLVKLSLLVTVDDGGFLALILGTGRMTSTTRSSGTVMYINAPFNKRSNGTKQLIENLTQSSGIVVFYTIWKM